MLDNPLCDCARKPYGESYFSNPTGRCSDGLLMIDFLANFSSLPFLDAYLNKRGNFFQGVNFAVAGATALDTSTLAEKYNLKPDTNLSLPVQLGWFKSHLNTICSNVLDCKRKLSDAVFVIGEIGGNDYNYGFSQGKSMLEMYQMVPDVVQAIISAMKEVINLGARRLIVPGNFPVGCMTIYLSLFRTNDTTMYDDLNCLKHYNGFAKYGNDHLRLSIKKLQEQHPDALIAYMDYYAALQHILRNAASYGFAKDSVHKACCGNGDDDYNVDMKRFCGKDGSLVCENPQERVSWDGIHLTQHAYHVMINWLLRERTPMHGIPNEEYYSV